MSSKVLNARYKKPDAGLCLICFNWAGGGANFYSNTWGKLFPDYIEVFGVCLPGREVRYNEPVCNKLDVILDELSESIREQCRDRPFAFWGHSLGALLAYEMCCLLKSRHSMTPDYLFLSGVSAPHSELRRKSTVDVSQYTDEEFTLFLKGLGGTPADIIENREFMKLFMPSLRADYELVNQCSFAHPKDRCVLHCPVDIFDGSDDLPHDLDVARNPFFHRIWQFYPRIDDSHCNRIHSSPTADHCYDYDHGGKQPVAWKEKLCKKLVKETSGKHMGWKEITNGSFSKTILPGGHFYLKDDSNTKKIVQHITDSLQTLCN